MIIGQTAVGLIIFALSVGSYFAVGKSISGDCDPEIGFLVLMTMSILFTGMALYILIQKGLI